MANKFDYQNMLNAIRGHKISKNKTPQFNEDEINGWNNAIELCCKIVERRREKFERKEAALPLHGVSQRSEQYCTCGDNGTWGDDGKCGICDKKNIT